ncbi:Aste57867_14599 [Aphanomyces stellatus]|uniref:Aste57867_14599 protein n=1 Tax=Aphanomyces stellatus TaxID=120398 RepID=A0A485L1W8_9STRA|nr:hypothetical protein As57867_014545 [Aphanomyces stellatus]VFT91418.1 Aste57867_14599 [Aphanomyces stellatus]
MIIQVVQVDSFMCPITCDVMLDPVVAADGHSYERSAISQWLKHHNTSPITNVALASKALYANHTLKQVILEVSGGNPSMSFAPPKPKHAPAPPVRQTTTPADATPPRPPRPVQPAPSPSIDARSTLHAHSSTSITSHYPHAPNSSRLDVMMPHASPTPRRSSCRDTEFMPPRSSALRSTPVPRRGINDASVGMALFSPPSEQPHRRHMSTNTAAATTPVRQSRRLHNLPPHQPPSRSASQVSTSSTPIIRAAAASAAPRVLPAFESFAFADVGQSQGRRSRKRTAEQAYLNEVARDAEISAIMARTLRESRFR